MYRWQKVQVQAESCNYQKVQAHSVSRQKVQAQSDSSNQIEGSTTSEPIISAKQRQQKVEKSHSSIRKLT